jgi:hypothetical protein
VVKEYQVLGSLKYRAQGKLHRITSRSCRRRRQYLVFWNLGDGAAQLHVSHINTMRTLLFIALSFASLQAFGADKVWLGPDRNKWPDTEFRKTKNDFAGVLLVTPDTDWEQKWNTPPDTIPYFREAKTVRVGENLVILTFFVNPKTDKDGNAKVICSIKTTRPNGTVSIDQGNIPCLTGKPLGNQNNIRLSPAVINFVGEKNDPLGKWLVEVDIQDLNRNTTLKLKTHFILEDKGG